MLLCTAAPLLKLDVLDALWHVHISNHTSLESYVVGYAQLFQAECVCTCFAMRCDGGSRTVSSHTYYTQHAICAVGLARTHMHSACHFRMVSPAYYLDYDGLGNKHFRHALLWGGLIAAQYVVVVCAKHCCTKNAFTSTMGHKVLIENVHTYVLVPHARAQDGLRLVLQGVFVSHIMLPDSTRPVDCWCALYCALHVDPGQYYALRPPFANQWQFHVHYRGRLLGTYSSRCACNAAMLFTLFGV